MMTYLDASPVAPLGKIGDAVFFVSDVWYRRMPTTGKDKGRLFLQVLYGRRDIAPRLQTTDRADCLSDEAVGRAKTIGRRLLWGFNPRVLYLVNQRLQTVAGLRPLKFRLLKIRLVMFVFYCTEAAPAARPARALVMVVRISS